MKEHYEQYEPTISALKRKYEAAMREKSLIGIERDRLQQSLKQLQVTTTASEERTDADTIKGAGYKRCSKSTPPVLLIVSSALTHSTCESRRIHSG